MNEEKNQLLFYSVKKKNYKKYCRRKMKVEDEEDNIQADTKHKDKQSGKKCYIFKWKNVKNKKEEKKRKQNSCMRISASSVSPVSPEKKILFELSLSLTLDFAPLSFPLLYEYIS